MKTIKVKGSVRNGHRVKAHNRSVGGHTAARTRGRGEISKTIEAMASKGVGLRKGQKFNSNTMGDLTYKGKRDGQHIAEDHKGREHYITAKKTKAFGATLYERKSKLIKK